jgi:ribonuclease HII
MGSRRRPLEALSLDEIRARCLHGDQPISPSLLRDLQRDHRRGAQRLYELLRRRAERARAERLRLDAMRNFERVLWQSGVRFVAGVDEAGMGPLAGPVVAAAVVFPPDAVVEGVDDSKRLGAEQREALAGEIRRAAAGIGVGVVEVAEIDASDIYRAGLQAMRRAVEALPMKPEHLLVDARRIPDLDIPQNPFEKGDGIDFSIAAASIIAKTHRDALMNELDALHPGYGFAKHKGYATAEHQAAIRRLGLSPVHRRSFAFLRELRGEYCALFYALAEKLRAAGDAAALTASEAELESAREALAESEHRKLRLLVARRWKAL